MVEIVVGFFLKWRVSEFLIRVDCRSPNAAKNAAKNAAQVFPPVLLSIRSAHFQLFPPPNSFPAALFSHAIIFDGKPQSRFFTHLFFFLSKLRNYFSPRYLHARKGDRSTERACAHTERCRFLCVPSRQTPPMFATDVPQTPPMGTSPMDPDRGSTPGRGRPWQGWGSWHLLPSSLFPFLPSAHLPP